MNTDDTMLDAPCRAPKHRPLAGLRPRSSDPDADAAAEAIRGWAGSNPQLAASLASGLSPAQAAARWGFQLLREHRVADAAVLLRAAAALAPTDPRLWMQLGLALDRSGRPEDAARSLERSLALSPEQPEAWLLLGLARAKSGNPREAEKAYRAALAQQPSSTSAWLCLGLLLEQQRDYGQAIAAFVSCVTLGGATAAVWANLGRLYYQTARVPEACEAFEAAVRMEPANAHYAEMLANARFVRDVLDVGSVDAALEAYDRAVMAAGEEATRRRLDLLEAAFGLLSTSGHTDAAVRVGRKRLELDPTSTSARYLLDVLLGEAGVARSPPEYIVETFDAFAETFDAKLVGILGYDVPEQLSSIVGGAVTGAVPVESRGDALDVGCGTGLCGPWLRPLSRTLVGVDLSQKMLDRAARRGVYDLLVRQELTDFLDRNVASFDLIVAADVLIYFGDLAPLFAAAAKALRPRGLLAVSTELLLAGSPARPGYRALPSGRFAHAPEYVRAAAAPAFAQEACVETTLRLEASDRVRGNLFLFRRR